MFNQWVRELRANVSAAGSVWRISYRRGDASWPHVSVATITWDFRILVLVLPGLIGWVTSRLLKAL